MMTPLERQVLDAIDVEGMLSFLCRLIGVPSLGGQESEAQQLVAEQMERSGLQVDLWEIDLEALRENPAHSEEVIRSEALGVVGTLAGSGDSRSLVFNGHVDVVPVGDAGKWTYPPWEGTLADGRVYGRGSVDMKGGLCCALFAARALRDAGIELAGSLRIHSVVGEEDGGTGTLAAIERGHRGEGAIIMEPTNLSLVPTQAGALSFRLSVPGRAAHGSMRQAGVNPLDKLMPLLGALRQLEADRNTDVDHPMLVDYPLPYPISIGKVRSGNWASSVPEDLVCEGRFGVAVGEDLPGARQQFETAVAGAAARDPWLAEHPPTVEWWGGEFASCETAIEAPIVTTLTGAIDSLKGAQPEIRGVTYGSDMRLLVNEGGIPTVLFGPGDVQFAHQTDEFVPIDDLLFVVRTLALTAMRFCLAPKVDAC